MTPDEEKNLDDCLIDAAKNGHPETVNRLLAAGADVHVWEDSALTWAAYRGYPETVSVLLANGAVRMR